MCDNSENRKKYKFVPPDGGWGYVICLSFMINMSTLTMFYGCFGILYNDFMIEIGMNSTETTFLTGLTLISFAVSGFVANSLMKLMSMRKLCLLSVGIHDAGAIGMVFVKSIPAFFLCQGILMGIGIGITYNLSCTLINEYFITKRMFAFSLVQWFVAVLTMVAPIFVKWSLQEYGFRGTMLLISGIMLHNIFGVVLMHPVKWHMKKVEVLPEPVPEFQRLLVDGKTDFIPVVKLTEKNEVKTHQEKAVKEIIDEKEKKSCIRRVAETFVDVSFAKKFLLSCVCTGPAICGFADSTYSIILPQALYALGWSQDKTALGLAISGFGDLAMRTVFICSSTWLLKLGSQQIYVASILVACLSRIGMLWSENEIAIFIFLAFMGLARCSFIVLQSIVVSEVVSSDKFTQAMGISMLFTGIITLSLGPTIGAIRDLTKSYNTACYLLTSCFAIVAIFWSIELCYKMNKDKRKLQNENLEKIRTSRLIKGK